MNTCNYCGRENADGMPRCSGCGTPLATEEASQASEQSVAANDPVRTLAEKQMLSGAVWCIGGLLVTGITYLLAANGPGGGTYIVAWGAILFGGIRFFRGLGNRNATPAIDNDGYEALADATKLETQGRVQEALAAYQKIADNHPDTDAGRDAQKSFESLKARLS